ncbi:hypothetical protein L1049_016217 [Liquidambar formosana]|uniref:DDE Tnp4 domain-containing protein n=1 Tax=Liquidambar formosana TaxID=63359 RepID=A0AAP0S5V2_LIQFO
MENVEDDRKSAHWADTLDIVLLGLAYDQTLKGNTPTSKYSVVDAGYPNMPRFLAPYKGEGDHLQDYRGGRNLRNPRELFHYGHYSLRNVIERCYVSVQKFIVVVACVVHHFIRPEVQRDNLFNQFENQELVVDDGEHVVDDAPDPDVIVQSQSQPEMEKFRDDLANAMFNAYNIGGVQNYRQ